MYAGLYPEQMLVRFQIFLHMRDIICYVYNLIT